MLKELPKMTSQGIALHYCIIRGPYDKYWNCRVCMGSIAQRYLIEKFDILDS